MSELRTLSCKTCQHVYKYGTWAQKRCCPGCGADIPISIYHALRLLDVTDKDRHEQTEKAAKARSIAIAETDRADLEKDHRKEVEQQLRLLAIDAEGLGAGGGNTHHAARTGLSEILETR